MPDVFDIHAKWSRIGPQLSEYCKGTLPVGRNVGHGKIQVDGLTHARDQELEPPNGGLDDLHHSRI